MRHCFSGLAINSLYLFGLLENKSISALAGIDPSMVQRMLSVFAIQSVHFKFFPARMMFIYRTQQAIEILSDEFGDASCFSLPKTGYCRVIVGRPDNPCRDCEIEGAKPLSEVGSENHTNAMVGHLTPVFLRGDDIPRL